MKKENKTKKQNINGIARMQQRIAELEKVASERQRIEEALSMSESLLDGIINQSPAPMWISDDKGTLMRLNQACRNLLNIADVEVVGKYNIFQDNIVEQQGLLPLVKKVFEKGEVVKFEIKYDSSQLKHLQLSHFAFVILDTTVFPIKDVNGKIAHAVIQHIDITERTQVEAERENLILELKKALSEIKTLSGLLPICAYCKKIRNDEGYWEQIEGYIKERSLAEFSHGICPECMKQYHPDLHK